MVPPKFFVEGFLKDFPLLRSLFQRVPFFLYVIMGGGLLFLNALQSSRVLEARSFLLETNFYLEKFFHAPKVFYQRSVHKLDSLWSAQEKITLLEKQVHSQQEWILRTKMLRQENAQLKALLALRPQNERLYTVAEIHPRSRSLSEESLLLSVSGTKDTPLTPLSPVVLGEILVGYIKESGPRSALVCPITASESRVPVISDKTKLKAVITGDAYERLKIRHLQGAGTFEEGELLWSTSEGSLYPDHYAVGRIKIDENHIVRVIPLFSTASLSHVFVLPPPSGG